MATLDTHDYPKVGARVRIVMPGTGVGIERMGLILGYDAHLETVRVRWYEYNLPDSWIPTRWL